MAEAVAKKSNPWRNFLYGKPHGERRLGDLYQDKTGLYKHREWRGVKDTCYAYWRWLLMWGGILGAVFKDPAGWLKGILRYRWMSTYLTGPAWVDRGIEGLRGMALVASEDHMQALLTDSVRQLGAQFRADANLGRKGKWHKKTVGHDETLEGHLFYGFPGYEDILIQLTTVFLQPHVCKLTTPHYIDYAESIGLPPDVCPLPAAEAGVAVNDDYPDMGPCILTSNCACDGSIGTSIIQELYFNKPYYAMPMPMRYDEPSVQEFAMEEVKGCIAFLEEQLGVPFNWEAFFKGCENYNQQTRFELEKWDVAAKTDNYPINGVAQALYRLFNFSVGYRPVWLKTDAHVRKIMDKCVKNDIKTFPNTRHRAVVWSCAPLYYSYIPTWMYNCWGINVVMNMDSMMGHNIIRTDSQEHALFDLAAMFEHSPMRTHAVGGYKHIFELWDVIEQFNADMVIMYDQVACKGMNGIAGIFDEEFRKRNVHAIWIPHELMDHRTVERPEMRRIVNDYMTTVMGETPLDPSLLEFDDSLGW